MHALRNIHAALAPDGSSSTPNPLVRRSWPPRAVSSGGSNARVARHDPRPRKRIAKTIAAGIYELEHESTFTVTDSFDDGSECLDIVSGWRGTHLPIGVSQQLAGRDVTCLGATGDPATATAARAVIARAMFDQQVSQHPSPRQLSRPSFTATRRSQARRAGRPTTSPRVHSQEARARVQSRGRRRSGSARPR